MAPHIEFYSASDTYRSAIRLISLARSGTPACGAKLKALQHKHLEASLTNTLVQNSLAFENGAILRRTGAESG